MRLKHTRPEFGFLPGGLFVLKYTWPYDHQIPKPKYLSGQTGDTLISISATTPNYGSGRRKFDLNFGSPGGASDRDTRCKVSRVTANTLTHRTPEPGRGWNWWHSADLHLSLNEIVLGALASSSNDPYDWRGAGLTQHFRCPCYPSGLLHYFWLVLLNAGVQLAHSELKECKVFWLFLLASHILVLLASHIMAGSPYQPYYSTVPRNEPIAAINISTRAVTCDTNAQVALYLANICPQAILLIIFTLTDAFQGVVKRNFENCLQPFKPPPPSPRICGQQRGS